jgi:hypothetical protein
MYSPGWIGINVGYYSPTGRIGHQRGQATVQHNHREDRASAASTHQTAHIQSPSTTDVVQRRRETKERTTPHGENHRHAGPYAVVLLQQSRPPE